MPLDTNPFVVLSYVSGPALLTNATSLILMSTTNRFARAIDRSRHLSELLSRAPTNKDHAVEAAELRSVGRRIRVIAFAIAAFYLAAAMFALATVSSIVGAAVAGGSNSAPLDLIIVFAVVLGAVGFAAFVGGALALVIETRQAMRALAAESAAAIAAMDRALRSQP
jgi:hypothetical protein